MKTLRTIALLLFPLAVFTARAETQEAMLQRTFDALRQSASALERGDTAQATALLDGIRSAAEGLQATADRYARQAEATGKRREEEARGIVAQIAQTYNAEQAAQRDIDALKARVADSNAQLEAANQLRGVLEIQAAAYRQEVKMRQECKAQPLDGLFYHGECWRLSFEDLFANRWIHLRNAIEGNNAQRNNIGNALRDLNRQLAEQQRLLQETSERKAQLESRRQALDSQARTLRAAVVSLSDATLFWNDMVTLIRSRLTSIETLQQGVQILVERSRRTAPRPVFDRYDREEVRSLEATLTDFARTLDNQTNILLKL